MRLLVVLAVVFAGAGFATAQPKADAPKPALVVHAKPVSRLLTEYKEMLRQMGGPAEGDRLVKGFEQELQDTLGDDGFEGLDLERPLSAYAVLKEKEEDCRLVVVLPVTGEKEFVAFLKRIKVQADPVEGQKGVYAVELPNDLDVFPNDSHLRFVDGGWAYLTLNDGTPTDAKDLVPVGDLLDNADQSLFSAKVFFGRVPEKLVATVLESIDDSANEMKMFFPLIIDEQHWAKFATTALEQGPKLLRRIAETGLKEATEAGVKFSFDRATGDTMTELTLVPKPGTALAKEIAAQAANTNRFAGLGGKDVAFSAVVKVPLFAPELRELGAALIEAGTEEVKRQEIPERLKAVADEVGKSLTRVVKSGSLDGAVALLGPDKNGKFTLVAGLTFDDAGAVEKALRLAAKDPDLTREFQFDAAKVGDVGVHKIPLARVFPEEIRGELEKVFGEKPVAYAAFAKDAVFVGIGSGSLDAVKAALELKPATAPLLEINGNMARLQKLVAAFDADAGMEFAKHLGAEDKPANMLRVVVAGGDKLTAKVTMNVRYLPKLFLAAEGIAPPPPPR